MISCICLTYGRHWLLAEAIESYLMQEFDEPAELVIVNDCESQTVSVDTARCTDKREIRAVNLPKRLESLNDKFDLGVQLARYDTVCFWDDDDISLPHRLSETMQAVQNYDWQYLAFADHFYCNTTDVRLAGRGIHGGDAFSKQLYQTVGGSQGDGHNDQNFVAKAKALGEYVLVQDARPFYLYRWDGGRGHTSGLASGPGSLAVCMDAFHRCVISDKRFVAGEVVVHPGYSVRTQGIVGKAEAMV